MQSRVSIMFDGNQGMRVNHVVRNCISPIFYLKTQLRLTFNHCFESVSYGNNTDRITC